MNSPSRYESCVSPIKSLLAVLLAISWLLPAIFRPASTAALLTACAPATVREGDNQIFRTSASLK